MKHKKIINALIIAVKPGVCVFGTLGLLSTYFVSVSGFSVGSMFCSIGFASFSESDSFSVFSVESMFCSIGSILFNVSDLLSDSSSVMGIVEYCITGGK